MMPLHLQEKLLPINTVGIFSIQLSALFQGAPIGCNILASQIFTLLRSFCHNIDENSGSQLTSEISIMLTFLPYSSSFRQQMNSTIKVLMSPPYGDCNCNVNSLRDRSIKAESECRERPLWRSVPYRIHRKECHGGHSLH